MRNKLLVISVLASIFNLGTLLNIAEAQPAKSKRQLKSERVRVTPDSFRQQSFRQQANRSLKFNNLQQQIDSFKNSESSSERLNISLKKSPLIANSFNGKASWYGPKFHGRRTASGEIFNQSAMTAAHPRLRFGTRVKVTNLNNGRSVIVRINDRGPFVKNRVIDLSAAAARSIGMISSGVAPVSITVLGR